MAKYSFQLITLFLILSCFNAEAQPAQKLVNIVVSPDHDDWKYKVNENAVFTIQVFKDNIRLQDAVVDYEIGPEAFPTEKKQSVSLKNGILTLKSTMTTPGFLRCRVWTTVNGVKYDEMATAGYDVDKITPASEEPKDFDAFWTQAIEDARRTPLDAKMTLLPERCTSSVNFYEVNFANGNARVYGILTVPKKEGKYPAVLKVPGAGIRPYYGTVIDNNTIVLEIGIHGIPVTMPTEVYNNLNAGSLNGYPSFNTADKDKHYYKRVYTGCIRSVDYIFSLPQFDQQTIAVTGGSQGGALSIITAGLDQRIKYLAAYYPALCDYAGYLKKRAGGWPHYFKDRQPLPDEIETLAYYDVVNFARRVKAPGLYSWGFNDLTCPPTSMHAAYNVITAPKELRLYLNTGHWTYPEETNYTNKWIIQRK
jgi:cephalosporin-C deacetylase-like acetyl esterase